MNKPECDYIKGLPPAIAIEQKVKTNNPRSTVGTSTEIYEYLRLLFARVGHTYSPVSGEEVRRHSADDIVAAALRHPAGTRFTVLAPLRLLHERTSKSNEVLLQQGLSRLDLDGDMVRMDEAIESPAAVARHEAALAEGRLFLLLDRLAVDGSKDGVTRLNDSVETALYEATANASSASIPNATSSTSPPASRPTASSSKNRATTSSPSIIPWVPARAAKVSAAWWASTNTLSSPIVRSRSTTAQ